MKHFIDRLTKISLNTVQTAIILDGEMNHVGSISLIYTKSKIAGSNIETGVLLNYKHLHVDFSKNVKHDNYNLFDGILKIMKGRAAIFTKHKEVTPTSADSMHNVKDISYLMVGDEKLHVFWGV